MNWKYKYKSVSGLKNYRIIELNLIQIISKVIHNKVIYYEITNTKPEKVDFQCINK